LFADWIKNGTQGKGRAGIRHSDPILDGVEWRGWFLSLVVSVIVLVFGNASVALGLFLGGALAMLNFRVIRVYFGYVLRKGYRPPWWAHGIYWSKFGLMALVLVMAFRFLGPHPVAVFGGFSFLVISLVWSGLRVPRERSDDMASLAKV